MKTVLVISSAVCRWLYPLTHGSGLSISSTRGRLARSHEAETPPPVEVCDCAMCSALEGLYLASEASRLLLACQRCQRRLRNQFKTEIYVLARAIALDGGGGGKRTGGRREEADKRSVCWCDKYHITAAQQVTTLYFSLCRVVMKDTGSGGVMFPLMHLNTSQRM